MTSAVVDISDGRDASTLLHFQQSLTALLAGSVTEVCVNRPGEAWTETSEGWVRHNMPDLSFNRCMQLARLIANFNGLAIDVRRPYVSGTLPGKERVQVVVPPACPEGTVSITIRKPSLVDKSLEELDAEGSFEGAALAAEGLSEVDRQLIALRDNRQFKDFLDLAVKSHKNILLAGATGSGKTTVMRSLAARVPHSERVITIEDAHELFMTGFPNKVHLFYRTPVPGQEGPQNTAQDALKSCMRMKPDRIFLAELRGDEAWNYMDSLNTGHPGSLSSIHANSALDAMTRLGSLIKSSPAGQNLAPDYLQQMCFETIDVVLFYKHRKLRELYFDPERRLAASRVTAGGAA